MRTAVHGMICISYAVKLLKYAADAPSFENFCVRHCFAVSNGVKQGAILSPLLFYEYYDNLLLAIRSKGAGCDVSGLFFGALAFADDVVFLTQSASAMRQMLSVCDRYSAEFNLSFNTATSKCLLFSFLSFQGAPFIVGSKVIEFVNKWSHLGHIINDRLDDDDDFTMRKTLRSTKSIICYVALVIPIFFYKEYAISKLLL
jgi:hypothetical protein